MSEFNKRTGFSSEKRSIAEIMQDFFRVFMSNEQLYGSIGTVKSVKSPDKTCVVEIVNGGTYDEIKLQQVSNNSGFFIVPSVGSVVLVEWNNNTDGYVALHSEIDEIIFQDGLNGGLIKVTDLTAKLNSLVIEVNQLISDFKNHQHAYIPYPGGVAGAPVATTWNLASVPPAPQPTTPDATDFDKNDYENKNFKH